MKNDKLSIKNQLTKDGLMILSAQGQISAGSPLVLQVLKFLSPGLSLSDGSSYMSAITLRMANHIPTLTQLSIIRVHQASFKSRSVPIQLARFQLIGKSELPIGKPAPFAQYAQQGFGYSQTSKPRSLDKTVKKVAKSSQVELIEIDKLIEDLQNNSSSGQQKEYQTLAEICPGLEDWRIIARVVKILPNTKPYEIKKGSNKGNKVTACNFLILDERSHQAICICYGTVADRLMAMLREGQIYQFNQCQVRQAPNSKQIYISIQSHAKVRHYDRATNIPTHKINAIPFNLITVELDGQLIDIIGIVDQVSQACMIKKQDGSMAKRLQFRVYCPESRQTMRIFFWEELITPEIKKDQPIIIKNIKVNIYRNSLHLISTYSTFLLPNSLLSKDHPVFSLRDTPVLFAPGQSIFSIAQLLRQLQITEQSSQRFTSRLRCFLISINQRNGFHYLSCIYCNKKVNREKYCERCCTYILQPKPRYLLNCLWADSTGQLWTTIYESNAETLLNGKKIDQLLNIGQQSLHQIVKDFKYTEWVIEVESCKTQTWVKRLQKVNCKVQALRLTSQLRQLLNLIEMIKIEDLV